MMDASFRDFIQSESWKKSAILGWVSFLGAFGLWAVSAIVAIWRGCTETCGCAHPIDIPGSIVTLTLGTLGISGLWQVGKRVTNWTPTEQARAHRIRNGERAMGADELFGNGE